VQRQCRAGRRAHVVHHRPLVGGPQPADWAPLHPIIGWRHRAALRARRRNLEVGGVISSAHFIFWCAQHGRDMEVKVLWRTRPQGLQANRKAQAARPKLKEAKSGSRGSTNRNWVEGAASQGEPAKDGEALVAKGGRRKPSDRATKVTTLTWGDLALCPKGRHCEVEREVSKGRSSGPRSRAGCTP
jgi:hypothetical protein